MKQTRAQAALEYLVTYGWAFLVIIAAISLLAYFGLINPNKYVPESCEFGEQLVCMDQYVDDGGVIILRFKNSFEEDIEIIGSADDAGDIAWYGAESGGGKVIIQNGEVGRIQLDNQRLSYQGDKERFDVVLTFQRSGGNIQHNISGSFYTEVTDSTLDLLN